MTDMLTKSVETDTIVAGPFVSKNGAENFQKMIGRFAADYPHEAIINALIHRWAQIHDISPRMLGKIKYLSNFIETGNSEDSHFLLKELGKIDSCITIKEIEGAFEILIDKTRRKSQGSVYTPDFIIDHLLEQGINRSIASLGNREIQICDPSCGSGGFLIRAAQFLNQKFSLPLKEAFSKFISGIDNDPVAITHANCLIELYLISQGVEPPLPKLKLICKDTLLSDPQEIWDSVGAWKGFHVLATNPPYVKLQNLDEEYRKRLTKKYEELIKGSFSLAILFLVAGHRLLARNGHLAFITQNNLFTSLAGEPIREYLQNKRCIQRIIDFGHQHVFDNASAYTCLIFLGAQEQDTFEFDALLNEVTPTNLRATEFTQIKNGELNPKKWRLAKGNHLKNLKRIESVGTSLGQVVDIRVGFATLKDSVFFVQRNGEFCIATGKDSKTYSIESEITKPAVKISDLGDSSDLNFNSRSIIFPYQKVCGKYQPIPESELRKRFPNAYHFLLQSRDLLATRDKGKVICNPWYAWGRTQSMEAMGPKLLTKTFSNRPLFILDTSDQLFCNGYAIFQRPQNLFDDTFDLKVLQRLLNSKVMHYYTKLTSFQLEGNYQCYQKNFIERFGVVSVNKNQAQEILSLESEEVDEFVAFLYKLSLSEIDEVLNQDLA